MNLIEELGLERCRAIVDGASEWCSHYRTDTKETICCHNENHFYFQENVKRGVEFIRLEDLRTAIAEYSKEFKVGDWVEPIAKGIFSKAMQLTAVHESHMEAGRIELNYGHWKKVNSNTDHVTDISNHVSPNTKVIEG